MKINCTACVLNILPYCNFKVHVENSTDGVVPELDRHHVSEQNDKRTNTQTKDKLTK